VAELILEISGPSALAALSAGEDAGGYISGGAHALAKHFAVRAATIYSGSSETQRNVIAKSMLAGSMT
jgi:alkylation response protein AidB-like acyl-CoA dehydrogenase